MAASCARCGAAVVSGMRTCQFCGAPMGDVEPAAAEIKRDEPPAPKAAPSQAASSQAASSQAASSQAASSEAAPGKDAPAASPVVKADAPSNGRPKKRTLSIALRVGLPLLGVALVFLLAWQLRSTFSMFGSDRQSSTGAAPKGSSLGAVGGSDLGVDIYPGATPLSGLDRGTLMDNSVVSQSFVSSDIMTRVIDFYKARMVGYTSIYASGNGVVVSISPSAHESVVVTISPAQSGGKTRIAISHTTAMSSK